MSTSTPQPERKYTRPLNRWHDEVGQFHICDSKTFEPVCNLSNYYTLTGVYPFAPHDNQVCGNCKRIAKARGL